MMGWYGSDSSFAPLMWLGMGLFWLGLIVVIIVLVVRLLPGSGSSQASAQPHAPVAETPEQILDRLFALGEIDEQTYRSRRTALAEIRRSS